ncbi:MAG: GNAT family N-acetyltransferase [Deferribacteres bacterium]|nr:GNAT family N-acetyltransferase [Deferribacteres bacterium]
MKLQFDKYCVRSWEEDDAPALAKYANNRKIWLNLRDAFPHPYDLQNARQFIEGVQEMQPETIFAIATETEAIGSIGFQLGQDVHRHSAELGYWLAEPFWGRGIVSEAILALTDFAFQHFNLARIYAEPYASNVASVRVLEKAGFQCEGRLVRNALKNGELQDQFMFAKVNSGFRIKR